MSGTFAVTEKTRVVRKAKRATYDVETVYAILDEALIASVAAIVDGHPRVQPMIHVREGDRIILHGLATNRLLNEIANGAETCINAMMIDALVYARRTEDHSMHYRSATVYGHGTLVADEAEKTRLMNHVFTHLVKSDRLRYMPDLPPGYLGGTMVVTIPITEASAKVNQNMPTDEGPEAVWSGLVPVAMQRLTPVPDERTVSESASLGAP